MLHSFVAAALGFAAWLSVIVSVAFPTLAQATDYHVSPDGDDDNPGTLEKPWKTITHALHFNSPVGAGDTVFLRGGDYYEKDVWCYKSGEAGKPITIRNQPDEKPVIHGHEPEYATVPNEEWAVHDAKRDIYKSVRTWDIKPFGALFKSGDRWCGLVAYKSREWLESDSHYYSDIEGFYAGPGYYYDPQDKHLYLRLTYPQADTREHDFTPTHHVDPRQTPLYIPARGKRTANTFNFDQASYIDISGLTFFATGSQQAYAGASIYLWNDCHHFNIRDINVQSNTSAICMRMGEHILIENLVQKGTTPPWTAWNDTKSGQAVALSLTGSDGIIMPDRCSHIEIRHCTFDNVFDAIRINSTRDAPSHDFHIHHNQFIGVRDDSISMGVGAWNVNIHHNRFMGVSKSVSRVGGENVHVDHPLGRVYIHHNVIQIARMFQTRRRSEQEGPQYINHIVFGTHDVDSAPVPQPWKIYHNTVVTSGPIGNDNGLGHEYTGIRRIYAQGENTDHRESHEVYNNIFVIHGDWHVGRTARIGTGQEIYDGNVYWRDAPRPLQSNFTHPTYDMDATPPVKSFPSIEAMKSDPWYAKSQAYYPPGWESVGMEADPQLDANDRPSPTGPAATPGVDLSRKNWPDSQPVPYRGALEPATALSLH